MPIFLEFYAVAVRQASVREHISEMYEQFSIPLTKLIEEDVAHPAIFCRTLADFTACLAQLASGIGVASRMTLSQHTPRTMTVRANSLY